MDMRITEAAIAIILLASVFVIFPAPANATPEYSGRSGQGCRACHVEASGGELTGTGLEFAASGYVWPPEGGYRVIGPIRKSVRFVIGLLHIVAAFIWFGTILYVHILLKPAYAEKGLPRGEVRMGAVSMAIVGTTGILLTLSRVKGMEVLYSSPWGIVLSIKIAIYIVMVSSAAFVVAYVGPRLKPVPGKAEMPEDGVFDPGTLAAFDGSGGKKALIAHGGKVYDVTGLKRWKNGKHMKHLAGTDMTDALANAPHGAEKLDPLTPAGEFDTAKAAVKTRCQRLFHVIAYMNLALVFVVLITIAYWRWGI
jgi:predicted heme/steroid binding protein